MKCRRAVLLLTFALLSTLGWTGESWGQAKIPHVGILSFGVLRMTRSSNGWSTTRQYARIVDRWVREIGLDPAAYGTHSLRRTKASLIYRRTKNLRAVQLLLGHTKLESTVRYL